MVVNTGFFGRILICVQGIVLCKLLAFTKLVVGTKKVCSFFGKTTQFTILLCMYSEMERIRVLLHEHNMYVNRFWVLYRKTLIFLSFQNGITLVQFSFALIFCNTLVAAATQRRPTQPFLQPELARIEAQSVWGLNN